MTEAEWIVSDDWQQMLTIVAWNGSERKRRLWYCGGCRQIAHLFFDPISLEAVEISERFADGQATKEELEHVCYHAEVPTFGYDFDGRWKTISAGRIPNSIQNLVRMGVLSEAEMLKDEPEIDPEVRARLISAANLAESAAGSMAGPDYQWNQWSFEQMRRVNWPEGWLIRCVFGNPFRPVAVDPAWQTGNVVAIAQSIYDERAFDRMPILADALEDAGCTNADVLNHCRQPGEHVRGCWVVDLILGKE